VENLSFFLKKCCLNRKKAYFCVPKIRKIMFAVVKIAGQQFKVTEGQQLFVPQITGKTGDKVTFPEVLLVDNDGTLQVGTNVSASVNAEIVNELVQGDKVIAFKMKRRKGFRKKIGHRTHYTQIKIESIA
jgi:large subunit ribosomal protein L21